jgi:hypothetical protein
LWWRSQPSTAGFDHRLDQRGARGTKLSAALAHERPLSMVGTGGIKREMQTLRIRRPPATMRWPRRSIRRLQTGARETAGLSRGRAYGAPASAAIQEHRRCL